MYETYIEQDFTIAICQITRGETPVKYEVFAEILNEFIKANNEFFHITFFL